MADDNKVKESAARTILNHAMNSEPSQMKIAVGKEIASRIMSSIAARRVEMGKKLFGN